LHVSTSLTFLCCRRDVRHALGVRGRREIAWSECAFADSDRSRCASHHASMDRHPGDRDGSNGASVVNPGWILLTVGVAGAVVMLVTSWVRRDQYLALGTVSHHWIAEQRLGQSQNSQH